jgi:hypothetical protein
VSVLSLDDWDWDTPRTLQLRGTRGQLSSGLFRIAVLELHHDGHAKALAEGDDLEVV